MTKFTIYFYIIWLLISAGICLLSGYLGAFMFGLTLSLIFGEWCVKNKKHKKSYSYGKISISKQIKTD